jgi:fructokinase
MIKFILSFGEILYDLFPSYRRLGGAPFNFAYHLHAFRFRSRLVSRVGDDEEGRGISGFLKNNIGTDLLQVDPSHATGKVLVQVDEKGVPDFTIVEDAAYDFIETDAEVLKAVEEAPALIYFGTLAQRCEASRSALKALLACNRSAQVLYDMNLRGNYYSREIVETSLAACGIVKLNDEELKICRSLLHFPEGDDAFVAFLMDRFDLEWVCLTRGEEGSELYHHGERFRRDGVPTQRVVDTVGAGDAYTAVLAMGILSDWAPTMILDRSTLFAGAICTLPGAIPEDLSFYHPYLHWLEEGEKR